MSKIYFSILALLLLHGGNRAFAQKETPLYAGKVPNSTNVGQVIPTLTAFIPDPEKSKGIAVIICPGGGYHTLVADREGTEVAKAYNAAGITAFVLRYRLPSSKTMIRQWEGPLQDAQQAIKMVRENAAKWGINPRKIGIMGFSAGGHLASSAGTHFDQPLIENKNKTTLRPDFMVLVYPVISFLDGVTHSGSRNNLIGADSSEDYTRKRNLFSNELHVTPQTPPTFITHAADDTVVPLSNTLLFYDALKKSGVAADLHIFDKGEHGYLKYPAFNDWFRLCLSWVAQQ